MSAHDDFPTTRVDATTKRPSLGPCISLPQSSGRELPSYFRRQIPTKLRTTPKLSSVASRCRERADFFYSNVGPFGDGVVRVVVALWADLDKIE